MDALEAIRHRRSVRRYTDTPVSDEDLDHLLRLALLAPTGGMSQSWGIVVVRDPERRAAVADIVMRGGARYFEVMRPRREGATDEEHAAWARDYASQALGTYPQVPVWIVGLLVPRETFPPDRRDLERDADMVSVGFMMENLFVAARARGLGTVPTVFHWFVGDELRELLGIPRPIEIPLLTPLGYPEEFPSGLPPALAKARRPWRSLVHDEEWGRPRAPDPRA